MPDIGDRVRVESTKVGQAPRDGVVVGVIGHLLRIRWSTGEESTVAPGPGAVAVTGRVRKSAGKKAARPAKKTVKGRTPVKKAAGRTKTTKSAKRILRLVTTTKKTSKAKKAVKKITKKRTR